MDPARAAALARFTPPLANAWMIAEITSADNGYASTSGRAQVTVCFSPVAGNTVQRDIQIRGYIPRQEEGDSPQVLKKVLGRAKNFVRAVTPDIPAYPARIGRGVYSVVEDIEAVNYRTGETVVFQAGEQLDFKDYNLAAMGVEAKLFEAMQELGDRTAELKGKRLFIKPGKAFISDEGTVSQFIDGFAAQLKDGDVYLDSDFIDVELQESFLEAMGLGDVVGDDASAGQE